MKDVAAGPTPQFLKGLAEIIQVLLIDEFEFACRGQSMNKAGNAIDDHAKIQFARTKGFLGTLPIVNIGKHDAPADNAPLGVPQGLAAAMEPAEYAVCTFGSVFRIIWQPGFDRAAPKGNHTLAIVRMDK